jgi:hypothetical protein
MSQITNLKQMEFRQYIPEQDSLVERDLIWTMSKCYGITQDGPVNAAFNHNSFPS